MSEESKNKTTEHRLGRYLLRYLVAQGGMGSVYLAQLPGAHGFEKWVAVKVIHPHLAKNARSVRMLLDEARVSAQILHPNVCSVLEFGRDEEQKLPYLVMEYLQGETFASVLRRGRINKDPFPRWLATRVLIDAARGLHAAHELKGDDDETLGVIHRDISPQNIVVLYDGPAKVLDFGIAQFRQQTDETKQGELKGRLRYIAPERLRKDTIDRRVDVWALGVVLWESTVHRPLFKGDNEGTTILSILEGEIPRPSSLVADYPRDLERVVMRALRRDPKNRYPTASALADDLERHLYGAGAPAGPAQIAAWMSTHFTDRLKARSDLLRAPPVDAKTIPEIDLGTRDDDDMWGFTTAAAVLPSAPPRKLRPLWIAAAALAFIAALSIAFFIGTLGNRTDDVETTPNSLVSAVEPTVSPVLDDARPEGLDEPRKVDLSDTDDDNGALDTKITSDASQKSLKSPDTISQVSRPTHPRKNTKIVKGPPGMLNLMAIPPATVSLRGRSIGRTPLFNYKLPAGRHRLTLRPLNGGEAKTITVRIRSGETVRKSLRF